jgi:hypothetical protein
MIIMHHHHDDDHDHDDIGTPQSGAGTSSMSYFGMKGRVAAARPLLDPLK